MMRPVALSGWLAAVLGVVKGAPPDSTTTRLQETLSGLSTENTPASQFELDEDHMMRQGESRVLAKYDAEHIVIPRSEPSKGQSSRSKGKEGNVKEHGKHKTTAELPEGQTNNNLPRSPENGKPEDLQKRPSTKKPNQDEPTYEHEDMDAGLDFGLESNGEGFPWEVSDSATAMVLDMLFARPLNQTQYNMRNWNWLRCRTKFGHYYDVGGGWVQDYGRNWLKFIRKKSGCNPVNWVFEYVNGRRWGDALAAFDCMGLINTAQPHIVNSAIMSAREMLHKEGREFYIYGCPGFEEFEAKHALGLPYNENGLPGVLPSKQGADALNPENRLPPKVPAKVPTWEEQMKDWPRRHGTKTPN